MIKNKLFYVCFATLIIFNISLLIKNHEPKSAEAQQCVKLGSEVCRIIGDFPQFPSGGVLPPSFGSSGFSGSGLYTLRCAPDEYVRSVLYRDGGDMDRDDILVECCSFVQ